MLSVVVKGVIILIAIRLNVVMLGVAAPLKMPIWTNFRIQKRSKFYFVKINSRPEPLSPFLVKSFRRHLHMR